MVEFSVRIDFYRNLEGPKDYVGSALRDGLTSVVLPRVGEHVLGLGPAPGTKALTANPTAWSRPSSTAPHQRGSLTRPSPQRRGTRPSCWCSRRCGPAMAPWPARACCGSTTLRAAGDSTSLAITPRSSRSRANRSWAGSTSKGSDAHEQPLDDRRVLNGILFVLATGIPWTRLPQQLGYGSGMTCWRRLRDWHQSGVWQRLHPLLLDELHAAGQVDWSRAIADSSHVRAVMGGPRPGRARLTAAGLAPSIMC
jgi:transposase